MFRDTMYSGVLFAPARLRHLYRRSVLGPLQRRERRQPKRWLVHRLSLHDGRWQLHLVAADDPALVRFLGAFGGCLCGENRR